MRVAVFVVSILVMASPSRASDSCMTMSEARQHFRSVHIYWHGSNHCWDATPVRYRQAHGIRQKINRLALQEAQEPKWREAMSELLPNQPPVKPSGAGTLQGDGEKNDAVAVRANWLDRWVDVAQIAPRAVAVSNPNSAVASLTDESRSEPIVTSRGVIVVCLGFLLIFVTVEFLFRISSINDVKFRN